MPDCRRIFGIDFTSAPSKGKPITCAEMLFDGQSLKFVRLAEWDSFGPFEEHLRSPGPWVTGIDFPFAQSRTFIENIGWPPSWSGYVAHVAAMSKKDYRSALDSYKANRAEGDKHHKRVCDVLAQSQSPQTTFGTPVGLMFYEGAHRLLKADVCIPFLSQSDSDRVVLESYPGVMVRSFIGKRSYKSDKRQKQTKEHFSARTELRELLISPRGKDLYGFNVNVPLELVSDPTGDSIDATLCAVQAAWAWSRAASGYGAPHQVDSLEGWICDPTLHTRS